jgi:hypothetical protein
MFILLSYHIFNVICQSVHSTGIRQQGYSMFDRDTWLQQASGQECVPEDGDIDRSIFARHDE